MDFEAEREDRCYEANPELHSLDEAYLEALLEREDAGMGFDEEKPLMEMWCRVKTEKLLKMQRAERKEHVFGWDVIG